MSEIKVAALVDNRRLVLNAGRNKKINIGDRFQVYAAKGKEVKDPDTNETLGTYMVKRLPVKIIEVEDKYSIAETYTFKVKNEGGNFTGGALTAMSTYFEAPKIIKTYDTFDIDETTRREIDEEKSLIKVGDIAKKIEDEA